MKRQHVFLTDKQIRSLKAKSKDGITVSEHIRRAVDEYVAKAAK